MLHISEVRFFFWQGTETPASASSMACRARRVLCPSQRCCILAQAASGILASGVCACFGESWNHWAMACDPMGGRTPCLEPSKPQELGMPGGPAAGDAKGRSAAFQRFIYLILHSTQRAGMLCTGTLAWKSKMSIGKHRPGGTTRKCPATPLCGYCQTSGQRRLPSLVL